MYYFLKNPNNPPFLGFSFPFGNWGTGAGLREISADFCPSSRWSAS